MAMLACLFDPDPDRRRAVISRILAQPLPNDNQLIEHMWAEGNWMVVGRLAPHFPLAQHQSGRRYSLVAGRLLDPDLDVQAPKEATVHPVGGFGVKLQIDLDSDRIIAVSDFLGTFPVYYGGGRDWMLITSCPWMFRCHPEFMPEWDLTGLAGVLHTMHILEGRTVWRGVSRVEVGHELRWARGGRFHSELKYSLGEDAPDQPADPEAVLHRMQAVLGAWLLEGGPRAMLLSGGLDSRLLVGLLSRLPGPRPCALTAGVEEDIEVQCARLVAGELRLPHRLCEFGLEELYSSMEWTACLEVASNGMNTSLGYAYPRHLQPGASAVTGYGLDAVMYEAADFCGSASTAEDIIPQFTDWGFTSDILLRLRRDSSWSDAVKEASAHLHTRIRRPALQQMQRAAQIFRLHGRQRHHAAGAGWRLAWGCWPVMSAYDAPTISMIWRMFSEDRAQRKLQRALVREHFPALARILVDNNSPVPDILLPAKRRHRLMRRLTGKPPLTIAPSAGASQLRYHRVFDINSPHWRFVRERVEPMRSALDGLFDSAELETLLPKPECHIKTKDAIAGSSGPKTLIGLFMLAAAMKRPLPAEKLSCTKGLHTARF